MALPVGPDDLSQAESGCRTKSEAKGVKGRRRRGVRGEGERTGVDRQYGNMAGVTLRRVFIREKIKESEQRQRGKNIGKGKKSNNWKERVVRGWREEKMEAQRKGKSVKRTSLFDTLSRNKRGKMRKRWWNVTKMVQRR